MAPSPTTSETGSPLSDADAFARLYDTHVPAILLYLRRRIGEQAAEDAATDVFVRAFRQRNDYEPLHPTPLPWLYGIAAHVIADHRRSEKRRLRALERLADRRPDPPSDRPAGEPIVSAHTAVSLRKLSHADRETLLLVAWGELTYDETATALQIPTGTVRSRLARARRLLDEDLRPNPPSIAIRGNESPNA